MSHALPYDVTCPSPQVTYLFYGTMIRVNPFRIETHAGGVAVIYTSSLLGSYDGMTFNLPVCLFVCVVCVCASIVACIYVQMSHNGCTHFDMLNFLCKYP